MRRNPSSISAWLGNEEPPVRVPFQAVGFFADRPEMSTAPRRRLLDRREIQHRTQQQALAVTFEPPLQFHDRLQKGLGH